MASPLAKFIPPILMPIARAANTLLSLRWPGALFTAKRKLLTRDARTYTKKLEYKLAHDRRDLLTVCADKVAARRYIADKVGEHMLPRLYASSDDPDGIDWSSLPREFVAKVNHGSGGTVIVWDGAAASARLPREIDRLSWSTWVVKPEQAETEHLKRMLRRWLGLRYGWGFGTRYEWAYKNVRPKVLVEELLTDGAGRLPQDYRCFVFNGVCRVIQVDSQRNDDSAEHAGQVGHRSTRRDFFDHNWQRLPVRSSFQQSDIAPSRPVHFDQMMESAALLAAQTDFVRADFYELGDRLVVGELTNYPTGGTGRFDPPSFDAVLGGWWQVPRSYSDLPDIRYEG